MTDKQIAQRCLQLATALEAGGNSTSLRQVAKALYDDVLREWAPLDYTEIRDTVKDEDGIERPRTRTVERTDRTAAEQIRHSNLVASFGVIREVSNHLVTSRTVEKLEKVAKLLGANVPAEATDVHVDVHVPPIDTGPLVEAVKAAIPPTVPETIRPSDLAKLTGINKGTISKAKIQITANGQLDRASAVAWAEDYYRRNPRHPRPDDWDKELKKKETDEEAAALVREHVRD